MNGASYCSQYGYYGTTFQNSASVSAHGGSAAMPRQTQNRNVRVLSVAQDSRIGQEVVHLEVESAPAYWFSTGCQYPDPSYPLVSLSH